MSISKRKMIQERKAFFSYIVTLVILLLDFRKYLGKLWKNDQILLRPTSRTDGVNISGTQMREFLASNLKDSFMQYLPPPLSDGQREEIWNILVPKEKNEHILRVFTSEYLKLI